MKSSRIHLLVSGYAAALLLLVGVSPARSGTVLRHENFNAGSAVTNQVSFEGEYPGYPDARVNGSSANGVFTLRTQSGNYWSYAGSGGIGNSGRASAPSGQDVGAVHNSPFNSDVFTTGTILRMSFDAYMQGTGTAGYGISFGAFIRNAATPYRGGINFDFNYGTDRTVNKFDVRANGVTLASIDLDASISANSSWWYRWTAEWTKRSNDKYDVVVTLEDTGSNGLAEPVQVGQWTRNDFSANDMSGDWLYAGWQGRARNSLGIFRIDNFMVEHIQPGTVLLLK